MTGPYAEALQGQPARIRPPRVETFTANTLLEARAMAQEAIDGSHDGVVRVSVNQTDEQCNVTVLWRIRE